MKKKLIIIFGIVILAIVVLSLITNYLDSARVRNSIEPKYVLKVVSKDGKKVTYWGLGYKIIRYPSVSSNEPYKNNRAVKMGSWFMKFELVHLYKDFTLRVIEEKNCNMKLNKYFKLKDRTLYNIFMEVKVWKKITRY